MSSTDDKSGKKRKSIFDSSDIFSESPEILLRRLETKKQLEKKL